MSVINFKKKVVSPPPGIISIHFLGQETLHVFSPLSSSLPHFTLNKLMLCFLFFSIKNFCCDPNPMLLINNNF